MRFILLLAQEQQKVQSMQRASLSQCSHVANSRQSEQLLSTNIASTSKKMQLSSVVSNQFRWKSHQLLTPSKFLRAFAIATRHTTAYLLQMAHLQLLQIWQIATFQIASFQIRQSTSLMKQVHVFALSAWQPLLNFVHLMTRSLKLAKLRNLQSMDKISKVQQHFAIKKRLLSLRSRKLKRIGRQQISIRSLKSMKNSSLKFFQHQLAFQSLS